MSRKIKGFALDSRASAEDVKARLKHQSLLQDFEDLQKDVHVMRNQLAAAKQRKLVLSAEVRFLRRRHRCLVEQNKTRSTHERPPVQASISRHQTKSTKKKQPPVGKEASKHPLPISSVTKPSKKQRKASQQVPMHMSSLATEPVRAHKGTLRLAKGAHRQSVVQSYLPMSDLNDREMMHHDTLDLNQKQGTSGGATLRNPVVAFDLNQDHVIRVPSSRAPIFDLNEISTGDEDFYTNVEANRFEESTKTVFIGLNDEQSNDLKLSSICRNSGERSSSRVGKRKISWSDPVALRV